jgi:hypothetical protein
MNEELLGLLGGDPDKIREQARMAGLLNFAASMLQASGPSRMPQSLGANIGAALPAYGQGFQGEIDSTLKNLAMNQKLQEEKRRQDAMKAFQSRIAAATTMQPTQQDEAATQSNIDPMMLEGMSKQDVINLAPKTQSVTDQGAINRAVMDYLAQNDPVKYAEMVTREPKAPPSAIQEYEYAVKNDGYKGTFTQYQLDKARAGATSLTLPSEGERKAGFLANRVSFGIQQMADVINANAPAASPEALPSLVKFLTRSDFLSNTLTSPDRQRIEAAQLDILDSALTLGTGAAYTREQLEGYRKAYFPQLGDSKTTVADKQKRLENLLESAYITAGRAAPTTRPSAISGGPSVPSERFPSLTADDLSIINKHLKPKK